MYIEKRIIIYSEKTPNIKEIYDEIAKYINPSYIPELEYTLSMKNYMETGLYVRSLEVIRDMYDGEKFSVSRVASDPAS